MLPCEQGKLRRNDSLARLSAGRPFVGRSWGWRSEACSESELRAAKKFCCGEPLLAFELKFEEFEPGVAGAGGEEALAFDVDLAVLGWDGCGVRCGRGEPVDDELFALEGREGAGPGLEATPAIVELVRAAGGEIHAAVFAIEKWSIGCACVILR